MEATRRASDEQKARWNGEAGRAWVESQALLDDLLQPIEDALVEDVRARGPCCVLDVGCGTGATTLAIARRLGEGRKAVGIDLSAPMIAAARRRAGQKGAAARFIEADAEAHDFAPASFDTIVSRFGVMFFADPVRAFANLRRAARTDAALSMFAWRGADENPFMTVAERAAAPLLPKIPPRPADGPGQFAFADPEHVRGILAASGWADIELRPVDFACTMPESQLEAYFTRVGPLGLVLGGTDDETRRAVVDCVRAAFEPFVAGDAVRFTAACWRIGARASG